VTIARRLLERTEGKSARWRTTDADGVFLFAGSSSSVTVEQWVDPDGDKNHRLSLLNSSGTEVAELRSTWDGDPWNGTTNYSAGPHNSLLSALYEAAKRSALRIDDVIDGLLRDLE
jgi:hypothetical protein